jgi:hypothetical protein
MANRTSAGATSGTYFLVLIGAAVYFIQVAHSFGDALLGILKAIVWPAVLIYEVLNLMHA